MDPSVFGRFLLLLSLIAPHVEVVSAARGVLGKVRAGNRSGVTVFDGPPSYRSYCCATPRRRGAGHSSDYPGGARQPCGCSSSQPGHAHALTAWMRNRRSQSHVGRPSEAPRKRDGVEPGALDRARPPHPSALPHASLLPPAEEPITRRVARGATEGWPPRSRLWLSMYGWPKSTSLVQAVESVDVQRQSTAYDCTPDSV